MKSRFLRAAAVVLLGTGAALAQAPQPASPTPARPEARAAASAWKATPAPSEAKAPSAAKTTVLPAEVVPARPAAPRLAAGPCAEGAVLPAGCLDGDGNGYRAWVNAEFLLWKIRGGSLPSLTARPPVGVLTVTATDRERTRLASGAVTPFTVVDQTIGFFPVTLEVVPTIPSGAIELGQHTGVRFGGGMWLTPEQELGVETSFYFLGKKSRNFHSTAANENGQFIFTTPFSDRDFELQVPAGGGAPTRTLIATRPLFFVRQANSELFGTASTTSWGGEANIRSTFAWVGSVGIGGLVGFRYVDFHEDFDLGGRFSLFRPNIPGYADPPFSNVAGRMDILTRDTILAKNRFYGAQVGLDFEGNWNGLFVSLRPRIALGGVHQVVKIEGSSTTVLDGVTTRVTPGGLLFAPLDVGRTSRDRFSLIPELNLKVGYNFTPWLRGHIGYDIMGFYHMVRPGDVTVTSSTTTTLTSAPAAGTTGTSSTTAVTVTQPTFRFRDSDILIQGINFGVELRY